MKAKKEVEYLKTILDFSQDELKLLNTCDRVDKVADIAAIVIGLALVCGFIYFFTVCL